MPLTRMVVELISVIEGIMLHETTVSLEEVSSDVRFQHSVLSMKALAAQYRLSAIQVLRRVVAL